MLRNFALIAGSLSAAAVLALGLAAAGFGPPPPIPDAGPGTMPEAAVSEVPDPEATVSRPTVDEVLGMLDDAGVPPAGHIVLVHPDGSLEALDVDGAIVADPARSSMDRLMQRLEDRLAASR